MALASCPNDRVTMLTSARGEHYFMCIDLLLLCATRLQVYNIIPRGRFVSCVIPYTHLSSHSLTRHGKSPLCCFLPRSSSCWRTFDQHCTGNFDNDEMWSGPSDVKALPKVSFRGARGNSYRPVTPRNRDTKSVKLVFLSLLSDYVCWNQMMEMSVCNYEY